MLATLVLDKDIFLRTSKDLSFKSVLHHFGNYLSAELLVKLVSVATIPIFTRLLSPGDWGIVSLFNTIVQFAAVILTWNYFQAVGRYYFENRDDIPQFIGGSLIVSAILFAVSCICLLCFQKTIVRLVGIEERFILPCIIVSSNVALIVFAKQIMQANRESKHFAFLSTAKGLGTYLVALPATFVWGHVGTIWSYTLVGLVINFYVLFYISKLSAWKVNFTHVKYSLLFCLPSIPSSLSLAVLNFADRIIINRMIGDSAVGLYSVGYTLGSIGLMISQNLFSSWWPTYMEMMNEKDSIARDQHVGLIVYLISVVGFLVMFLGEDFGRILLQDSFHPGLEIVPIIAASYSIYAFTRFYFQQFGYFKATANMFVVLSISACSNYTLNTFLVPFMGFRGAAYATLLSFMIMLIFSAAICVIRWPQSSVSPLLLAKPVIITIGCLVICYWKQLLDYGFCVNAIINIAALLLICWWTAPRRFWLAAKGFFARSVHKAFVRS